MHSKRLGYILTVVALTTLGVAVQAEVKLPYIFSAGTPIKATEVNANFKALADGVTNLETGKQTKLSGSPCGAGQFVRGVGADGKLECAVDQVGTSGSAGVSSLNGKSGSLVIQAGTGVKVDTANDGKITVSTTGGGGGSLSLPFSGLANTNDPAFSVKNTTGVGLSASSDNANAIYAISTKGYGVSAYSETSFGVVGFTNTGISGVYGESKVSGATGVRGVNSVGPGSSGVWGESSVGMGVRGSSSSGTGVQGDSDKGYGVKGVVSQAGTGVYGENTSTATAGAGVQGRANYVNSVGVNGLSNEGTGVSGSSNTNRGVTGTILLNTAGAASVAVEGINKGAAGYGVRGEHKGNGYGVYGTAPQVGVGGESANIGVFGRGPTAMKAEGNAVQSLASGGWVKATAVIANNKVLRCFNSQLPAAEASRVPCGISLTPNEKENTDKLDFGFRVDDRFVLVSGITDPAALMTRAGDEVHQFSIGLVGLNGNAAFVVNENTLVFCDPELGESFCTGSGYGAQAYTIVVF